MPKSHKSTLLFSAFLALALLFVWYAAHSLLVIFAAILLAIFLRALGRLLRRVVPVSAATSIIIVVVVLLIVIGAGIWLLAPRVVQQLSELTDNLPRAFSGVADRLEQSDIGKQLIKLVPPIQELTNRGAGILTPASWIFSTSVGLIVNLVIILFVGLYLALDPERYVRGFLLLISPAHRSQTRDILSKMAATMRQWLVGRILLMLLDAFLTGIGLWLLGVPLALTLGLIVGLLSFIPNLGPIVASIPAILIGLLQSPTQALYVAILYLAVQTLDGYVFTPIVQRHTVKLPPALTITSQLIMGVLLGAWGVLFATPLLATAIVLINQVYVRDSNP
jgi:predicted PurR-regulated permease PerM